MNVCSTIHDCNTCEQLSKNPHPDAGAEFMLFTPKFSWNLQSSKTKHIYFQVPCESQIGHYRKVLKKLAAKIAINLKNIQRIPVESVLGSQHKVIFLN